MTSVTLLLRFACATVVTFNLISLYLDFEAPSSAMNPPPAPGSQEHVDAAARVPLPPSPASRSRSPSPTLRGIMTMLSTLIIRTSVLETTIAAQQSAAPTSATAEPASKPEPASQPEPTSNPELPSSTPPSATAEPVGLHRFPPGTPIPPLAPLDGETPSKVLAWLHTAQAWLNFCSPFPTSTPACVNYIGTFFLTGRAALWWQACCAAAINTPLALSGGFSSFAAFHTAMVHALGVPFPQDQARKDLDAIKQTSTLSAYAAKFQSIVAHLPASESANHLYAFIRGLKPELQAFLSGKINNNTDDWHKAHTLASTFESTPLYRPSTTPSRPSPRPPSPATRLSVISSFPSSTSPRRGRSPTPRPSNTSAFTRPKLLPLTDDERAELIAKGGCFRCRQIGHMQADCKVFPSNRPAGPSRGASPSGTAPKN